MSLRSPGGDAESGCDLLVRQAGGDQRDHLTLPVGDRGIPLDHQFHHHGRKLCRTLVAHHSPEGVFADVTPLDPSDASIAAAIRAPHQRSALDQHALADSEAVLVRGESDVMAERPKPAELLL
jgi:hypothetical protein